MGGYETPGRLVTTLPRASNEASSGEKTGIFFDFDFFTASDGAVLLRNVTYGSRTAPSEAVKKSQKLSLRKQTSGLGIVAKVPNLIYAESLAQKVAFWCT